MVPTSREIARQLAVLAILSPEKTISELAHELAYPVLFIVNAVKEGKRAGLFVEDRENDKLILMDAPITDSDSFGEEIGTLGDNIYILLENVAEEEQDMEEGQLRHWLIGVRKSAIDIALYALKATNAIDTYEITDPKDDKSVYTFITLKHNVGKQWGIKQFKEVPEEKA